MEIRYATIDDYADFIVLEAEIQTQHHIGVPSIFPPNAVISYEDYLDLMKKPDEKIIVAIEDGAIVGYLQYELDDDPPVYYKYPEKLLYVAVLTVKETHRGRGIGEALVERAKVIAQEFGANRLSLQVYTFNDGAIRFYERVGFEPIKQVMSMTLKEE